MKDKNKKWLKAIQSRMKKPRTLKKGSTIAAVAFSDRVTKRDLNDLNKSIDLLEKWGLKVIVSKHLTEHVDKKTLPSPDMMISEMLTLAKNDIDGFYCVKGGFEANRLFHFKNFNRLMKIIARKHICMLGFSDATTVQIPLVYYNQPSFYCPNLTFLHKRSPKTKKFLLKTIFAKIPLKEPISDLEIIQGSEKQNLRGILLAGNLMTMHDCFASDYNPLTKFNEVILMVEEIEESEENVGRFLSTMTAYSSVKAAIINFKHMTGKDFDRRKIKKMLTKMSSDDIPVFWYQHFGHLHENQFFRTVGTGWPVDISISGKKGKLRFLPLE